MVEYDIGVPYNSDIGFTYNLGKPAPDTANIPYSYVPGNVQIFGSDGFAVDKDVRLDDTRVGPNILWSSTKTNEMHQHGGSFGNFAVYDGKGGLFDSNVSKASITSEVLSSVDSSLTQDIVEKAVTAASSQATAACYSQILPVVTSAIGQQLGNKLDTVSVYTTSNVPIFNVDGQLMDSNVSLPALTSELDALQAAFNAQGSAIGSQVQTAVDGQMQQLLVQQQQQLTAASNQLQDKYTAADAALYASLDGKYAPQVTALQQAQVDANTLMTALDSEVQNKIDVVFPAEAGNVPVLDANGSLVDSRFRLSDLSDCATRITDISNQHAAQTQQLNQLTSNAMVLQPGARGLPVFDAAGQVVDGGVTLTSLLTDLDALKMDVSESVAVPTTFSPNQLPVFTVNGQLADSGVNVTSLMPKATGAAADTLASFNADGTVKSSGVRVSDGTVATDVLWSSTYQATALDAKVDRPSVVTAGNVALFSADGHIYDGGALPVMPVNVPPQKANTLVMYDATGQTRETDVLASDVMRKTVPSYINNIAVLGSDGQVGDSNVGIDDMGAASANTLWTSQRTSNLVDTKMPLVPTAMAGHVGVFDATGKIVDSGADVSQLLTAVDNSIPRVMNVTQLGQLATLSQDGGVEDSGLSVNDVQRRTVPMRANNLSMLDANGMIKESAYRVDDASMGPETLWTSQRVGGELDKKLTQPTFFTSGNVPMFDGNGQLIDSSTSAASMVELAVDKCRQECGVYLKPIVPVRGEGTVLALAADGRLKDTQLLQSELVTTRVPTMAGAVATLDATGQLSDSGYQINDSMTDTATLWSSYKTQAQIDGKLSRVTPFTSGNIAVFDATGQLMDGQTNLTALTTSFDQKLATGAVHPVVPAKPMTLSMWDANGQQLDTGITASDVMTRSVPAVAGSLAMLDGNGQVKDAGYVMDDASSAATNVMWSSSKLQTSMTTLGASKLNTVSPYATASIPMFGVDGQLVDSGVDTTALKQVMATKSQPLIVPSAAGNVTTLSSTGTVQDSGFAISDNVVSTTTLQSSSKTATQLAGKMNTVPLSLAGNVPVFDASGQVIDGSVSLTSLLPQPVVPTKAGNLASLSVDGKVMDSQVDSTALMLKPTASVAGHLATFDNANSVKDSMYAIDDGSSATPQVLWSSDKINRLVQTTSLARPTTTSVNSMPVFDASGQLVDSGVQVSSLATKADLAADYQTKQVAVQGNVAVWNAAGQTIDSSLRVDDNAPPSSNVLYTSSLVNTKLSRPVFYQQDNLPIFDSDGQLTDSGTSLQTLTTTIQALNEQAQAQANVVPAVGDSLVLRAADGKLKETAIRVDDTAARSTAVLWTSAKVQALAPPTTPLTMALLDATGQVTSTNLKVDDTATAGTNILWSSSKVASAIAANVPPSKPFYYGTVGVAPADNGKLALVAVGGGQVSGGNTFTFAKAGTYEVWLRVANANGLVTYTAFHNTKQINILNMYHTTTCSGHTIVTAAAGDTLYFTVSNVTYMGTAGGEYCIKEL